MGKGAHSSLLVLVCVTLAVRVQAKVVKCSEGETLETALVTTYVEEFHEVKIAFCPPPAVSYEAVLASHFNYHYTSTINTITTVNKLILREMPVEPPLQRAHFNGLALSELNIDYALTKWRKYVSPDTSFLDSVIIGTLDFHFVNLPPLPQSARMEKVILAYGQSLGAFGGCSNLRELVLYRWDVERVPERWLAHCSKLTVLQVLTASPELTSQALERVLGGATSLREIKIHNWRMGKKIDVELAHLVNLQRLDLSNNLLENISAQALPASLTRLDLSKNLLWSSAQVAEVLQRLPALQYLSIGANHKLDLCQGSAQMEARPVQPTLQQLLLPSIKNLSAAGTATHRLCFGAMRMDSLTDLDLSKSAITELKFRDLPVSKAPRLVLNMKYNPVREVALMQADYEMMRDRILVEDNQQAVITVTGMNLSIGCDCEHGWLAQALLEGLVSIEDMQCSGGKDLAKLSIDRMQCDKFTCEGGACTCRRTWRHNTTVARCAAGALHAVPRIPGLRALHAARNRIHTFSAEDLPDSLLLLDLTFNNVSGVDAAAAAALFARPERRVRLTQNPLLCDCENSALLAALQDHRAQVEDFEKMRCSDSTNFASVSPERVRCNKFACAGDACTCRRAWRDNATVARCDAGALRAVPRITGLRALYAASNRVRTFSVDELPDTLLILDLSGNNVSGADAAAAAALFARPERRVWLAHNPLRCDCENRALLAALRTHRAQVEDYDNMTCLNKDEVEQVLRDVDIAELCTDEQSRLTLALAGIFALVGLTALAAALYYRYGRFAAVYIFTHGWCLNCEREGQLDPDRPFDAFVSFAHADYEFVTQHLLPGLESEPHKYRLCVHTRDWVPGEMISAQIARSVRLSRRTIIVLSRNFLESVWGLLEFRMAHVSALSEGRVRVVVVVLDGVLDEGGLDPELHTYLRTHTYVQWGDAWFWRKLRYALPHRSTRTDDTQMTGHEDKHDRDPAMSSALPKHV